ncbi:type II toxin-antitoxin system PemK/MazF family toxin [Spirosoma pollinicola]|uniref:type II toxin-antitoxin system PemK/MazF family toxin n=1 Tax=Spirosoma pollinicola TaxID=2057025 RepID=UPI0021D20C66|nr:type II toxin-antitoxin system PemK/MazF family toxin [Spirosoma pollinicola]
MASIQQSDGVYKPRPVLLLRQLPGYGDFLVCAISSQIRQTVPGFDEVLQPNADNQLRAMSVVRLSNLISLPADDINRAIGYIPDTLLRDLLQRLAD